MGSSSSFLEPQPNNWPISREYKFLEVLGQGGFGKVYKCVKRGTQEIVAIKIGEWNLRQEASVLKDLIHNNMHEYNIIKFHGKLNVNGRTGLVFEVLDISLQDYLLDLKGPMRLEDIRTIVQQMATAFDALKRIGVIHTDVKIDNIMMVDHVKQPFRVKLIDFGLAIYRSEAKPGKAAQTLLYRSPEIILRLPFSEAIDMWSLGVVMGIMVFGFMLFLGKSNYDALRYFIDLLGPPPDHLLDASCKSKVFFKKTDSNQWILVASKDDRGSNSTTECRLYTFRSLDEAKTIRVEKDNELEADERGECIELLKEMLKWDGNERITPQGILNHPFITQSYLNRSSHLSACSQAQHRTNEDSEESQDDDDDYSHWLSSGVIKVQPAVLTNRIYLGDASYLDSEMSPHPAPAPAANNAGRSPTTSGKKEKKRSFSWMKGRELCSCCCLDDAQERRSQQRFRRF